MSVSLQLVNTRHTLHGVRFQDEGKIMKILKWFEGVLRRSDLWSRLQGHRAKVATLD
jgi:hypothetical protein